MGFDTTVHLTGWRCRLNPQEQSTKFSFKLFLAVALAFVMPDPDPLSRMDFAKMIHAWCCETGTLSIFFSIPPVSSF